MHVQLVARRRRRTPRWKQGLLQAIARRRRPARLVLWPYARFPFGMTLDYERKFSHYVAEQTERRFS